jgi:hypothetical protein
MDLFIYTPILLTIGGGIFYFKKNKEEIIENEDIELWETDYDADCPIIFFDKNGNFYYVYK